MKQDFLLAKEELSKIGIKRVAADFYQEPKRKGTIFFVRSPAGTDRTASLALFPNSNRLRSYINRVEMGSESENEFLRHEITKAHKKNSFIVQALGEMSRSEQDTLFGNGAEPEGGTTAE